MSQHSGVYLKPAQRIKVACDECHARRVRCNGHSPCNGCPQIGVACLYTRPLKKRGGASAKQKENFIHRRRLKAATRSDEEMMPSRTTATTISVTSPPIISKPIQSLQNKPSRHSILTRSTRPNCKYPILEPVLHSLHGIASPEQACTLLELYFAHSAWGTTHLLRRASFLTSDLSKIRTTKPALLYSLLCLGSLDRDSDPRFVLDVNRRNLTDTLFELAAAATTSFYDLEHEAVLDDVITHIQLATIASSSKYQKKSIEWWSAAYQLARQLRLNEEVSQNNTNDLSLEQGEERRRVWWLLYCIDRHQALSVRKSLAFRDAECHDLRRPCDDLAWNSLDDFTQPPSSILGITYTITDCSFFGFFLPLMTILGEITEQYNFEESGRPLLAKPQKRMVQQHLDQYEASLGNFTCSCDATKIYQCYARHTLSTLYVLSRAKWDPVDALLDVETSGLSEEAIYSAAMATISAKCIRDIKLTDPRFGFMPLIFGTFALHCSFPLLLLIRTFGAQSDENIIEGCESFIDASIISGVHGSRAPDELASISPYLANMISIIQEVKAAQRHVGDNEGMVSQSMQDINNKAHEILSIYRWNKTGHGVNT